MKRIVTVQDISCVGKCSLTVALPIISAMGVETAIIPTAVLSTHTMFKGFTFHDLTAEITPIVDHWKDQKISFDAVYTGYLGSFEQLALMEKLIADLKAQNPETLAIVDPCMADNGKLYPGFTVEFAKAMGNLCSKADIVVPNITEACFMLGLEYKESGYDASYIEEILKKLAALGAKKIVLKGVQYGDGKLGIVSYDSATGTQESYFHDKCEQSFHGTGDIFASVLTGALMRGASLKEAYSMAGDFVVAAIKETLSHEDHNNYGVDFEAVFPMLLERLAKLG